MLIFPARNDGEVKKKLIKFTEISRHLIEGYAGNVFQGERP